MPLSFLCSSLFSLTCFFFPVVCFLAVVVVFEVRYPHHPPTPISSSSPSLPFVSLLPSGWSLDLCLTVLSSLRSRPGLTLSGCSIQKRVSGRFGWSWWGGAGADGILVLLFGITLWHGQALSLIQKCSRKNLSQQTLGMQLILHIAS